MKEKLKELIKSYYSRFKRFPKIAYLRDKLDCSVHKTVMLLKELVEDNFLFLEDNQYKINKHDLYLLEHRKQKLENMPIIIIRIVMAVIGVFSAFMSVYYTSIWLFEFLNTILAILLSTVMVLFSVACFETIIILRRNKQHLLYSIFIFLWIIVLVFSITSTVAGQYNKRIENTNIQIIENTENIQKNMLWEIYNDKETELVKLIEEKQTELEVVNNLLLQFNNLQLRQDMETEWLSSLTTKRKAEEQIKQYRTELEELRQHKIDFLNTEEGVGIIEETKIEDKSFYVWIGEIIMVQPNLVEFWLAMIPACFIDIISPLAIAVAMFLRRRNEEI